MNRDNLLFAIIGLLLGFILGFIFASTLGQRHGSPTSAAMDGQRLPPDHPDIGSKDSPDPQQVFAQVQEALTKARSEPTNFEAQMKAAELYYQIQRYDQAIEFLLKANQLKPDDYDAVVALGQVNLDAAQYDNAEKWYKAAALKRPDDVRVLTSLAYVALEKRETKQAEQAIARLEKVAPSNEDLPRFRERLASLQAGEKEK